VRSSIWKTTPVDCPPGSQLFLNAMAALMPDLTETPEHLLSKLKALENLEELRLDSAGVSDAGVDTLTAFRHLKLLNLYHTLVTEPGYKKLKEALPGCHIIWDRDSSLPTRRGS